MNPKCNLPTKHWVFWVSALFLFSSVSADAALFSASKAKRYRKKMERKHNPNNSGAGLQKVEIEMVRYYAKQARRGKTKKCKSKAKKKLVKGLQRVRKVKSLRKATTFRGVWEVTVSSGNGNSSSFFLHFSNVNEQNDFVSGTVENPLNNPTNTFGGWENLQTVRIATNAFNFYILNISGDTLSGTVQDSRFAGGSPVTGTRIMGP